VRAYCPTATPHQILRARDLSDGRPCDHIDRPARGRRRQTRRRHNYAPPKLPREARARVSYGGSDHLLEEHLAVGRGVGSFRARCPPWRRPPSWRPSWGRCRRRAESRESGVPIGLTFDPRWIREHPGARTAPDVRALPLVCYRTRGPAGAGHLVRNARGVWRSGPRFSGKSR